MISLLALLAAQQRFDLTPQPKAGQEFSYQLSLLAVLSGSDFKAEGKIQFQVEKVEKDGRYSVISTQKGVVVTMVDSSVQDNRENPATTVHDQYGKVLSITGRDEYASMRVAYFTRFVAPPKPVAIGETWQVNYAKSTIGPEAKVTYKVVEPVKLASGQALKVSFTGEELGIDQARKVSGEYIIDLKDRWPREITVQFEDPSEKSRLKSYSFKRI